MNHVRHQFIGFLLWALYAVLAPVQVAHAQGTATVDQYCFNNTGGSCAGTWKNTPTEACAEGAAFYSTANAPQTCVVQTCSGNLDSPARQFSCKLTAGFVYTNGLSYRSAAGTLPCPSAGTKSVRDFTIGYSNSPNDGAPSAPEVAAYSALVGSSRCMVAGGASCGVTLAPQANMAYMSTQPTSTGLYRVSVDIEVTYSGTSCTPSATDNAATNAAQAVPPCPGAYGTVNGKPTCVLTSPGTAQAAPLKSDGTAVPVTTGNPAAGSSGADPVGNRVPTSGTNGANNGSPVTAADGVSVGWGKGVPANAGTTSGASGSSLKAEDIKTDCDKKPNSIGCQEFGTPDNSVSLGRSDSGFSSIGVVSFGSSASCPAPLPFDVAGRTYSISFQSICTNANDYIRPVVLVLGAALAAFIFVAGFRS